MWGCDTRRPTGPVSPVRSHGSFVSPMSFCMGRVGHTIPIFPDIFLNNIFLFPEHLRGFQEHLPAARGAGAVAGGDGRRAPRGRGLGCTTRHLRGRQGLGLPARGEGTRAPSVPNTHPKFWGEFSLTAGASRSGLGRAAGLRSWRGAW